MKHFVLADNITIRMHSACTIVVNVAYCDHDIMTLSDWDRRPCTAVTKLTCKLK